MKLIKDINGNKSYCRISFTSGCTHIFVSGLKNCTSLVGGRGSFKPEYIVTKFIVCLS